MKRLFSLVLSLVCLMGVFSMPVQAAGHHGGPNRGGHDMRDHAAVEVIRGEEIKEYLAAQGEEYDPDLIAVYRIIPEEDNSGIATLGLLSREYYSKNVFTTTYTDTSFVVKEFGRPAGLVKISESVEISNTFSAEVGVSVKAVEAALGFSVTQKNTFSVEWEERFPYSVRIVIYPVYQQYVGEVWEDDVWDDDYLGTFCVKKAIGDDIRVYKR